MKKTFLVIAVIFLIACQNQTNSVTHDTHITQIDLFLDSLTQRDMFSGVALIAKNDSILLQKAYGLAHIGHKVPNEIDTKFCYASIGKSFTAVAIFQLIQKGGLSLDDTLGKFLPDYPDQTARDSVTIKMLLTHRSGMPNYFASEELENTSKDRFRKMEDLAPLYENKPMESKPGMVFSYRNTNYVVLARVLESITGIAYEDYIQRNIFEVSNMENTGLFDLDHPIENAAEGYTLSEAYPGQFMKNIHLSTVRGSAAGGGFTTAVDLYRFALAFENNLLLDPKYTTMMKTPLSPEQWYGYGMQFPSKTDPSMYGHSGGHFGVGSEWRVYGKEGYVVILLTNRDADQGFLDARFFIQKEISGETKSINGYFFTKKVARTYMENGYDHALDVALKNKDHISERDLNSIGYQLIKKGNYEDAINIFRLQTKVFPDSYDAFDSLGEAFMKNQNLQKAISNYEKSLEMNPENENARKKLLQLKGGNE